MSWKPEVIADSSGKWFGNALRFETKEEAEANVAALKARWLSVTDTRVVESDEPVNYKWVEDKLVDVTTPFGDPEIRTVGGVPYEHSPSPPRTFTIEHFLSREQGELAIKLWIEHKCTISPTLHAAILDQVIHPNMEEINRKLGQANDPKYLTYAVEFALSQSVRPKQKLKHS